MSEEKVTEPRGLFDNSRIEIVDLQKGSSEEFVEALSQLKHSADTEPEAMGDVETESEDEVELEPRDEPQVKARLIELAALHNQTLTQYLRSQWWKLDIDDSTAHWIALHELTVLWWAWPSIDEPGRPGSFDGIWSGFGPEVHRHNEPKTVVDPNHQPSDSELGFCAIKGHVFAVWMPTNRMDSRGVSS